MPIAFEGKVEAMFTRDDASVVRTFPGEFKEYSCRDIFLSSIAETVADIFFQYARGKATIRDLRNRADGECRRAVRAQLLVKYHERLHLDVSVCARDFELLSSFHVPHAIELLADKFPNVEFTPTTYTAPFNGVLYHGAKLSGDASVVPAFYWFVLMLRLAQMDENPDATNELPWTSMESLLDRSSDCSYSLWNGTGKMTHIVAWNQFIKDENETPPWMMIAGCAGPIHSKTDGHKRVMEARYNNLEIARRLEQFVL